MTPLKRCAILGTAPSWKQAPFADQGLEIWGLNDGYLLGQPRATRWFDLHPFHQMVFKAKEQRTIDPRTVPVGAYFRPEGHLEWLRTRTIPVYLQEARPGYPSSRTFPKDELLKWFAPYWPLRVNRHGVVTPGPDYEVSTPSWMLMLAIMEGYQEIHVYGIHLATQWEYVQQRPNFEFLLGIASALGRKVLLPESAPICKASYQYAFAPKADLPVQEAQLAIDVIKSEGAHLQQQIAKLPWYAVGRRRDLVASLTRCELDLLDAKQALGRAQALLQAA